MKINQHNTMNTLKKWTRPACYVGQEWSEYFSFLGQSRDSDSLKRSNFDAGLKSIGGESETVIVVRESHWAVGWVEWIAIHESDSASLETASHIKAGLEDYPVVDDDLFSQYEQADADETWKNCFRPMERIEWIRKHRSQFDFHNLADMLGCVRGQYFSGYACDLLN